MRFKIFMTYQESKPERLCTMVLPSLCGPHTISYRINRKKVSHEFAIKILNATGYSEYFDHAFNYKTQKVDIIRDGISMPNIYYNLPWCYSKDLGAIS